VPFVPDGSRKLVGAPIEGSADRRLAVVEDWHITAALMLNVYPFGRRRGEVAAFTRFLEEPDATVADLVGFQFGLDLDLSEPLDQWYFGLVLEPITGFSVDGGLALLQQDFLPRGFAEGMLVPAGGIPEPSPRYVVRPYFGVTLSLDIIETLATASRSVRGTKFTQ
jgi:hypothetical protein